MTALDKILLELPEQFSRQDFMTVVGEQTAFSYDYASQLLYKATFENKIKRVKYGVYQKTEPELETA